MYLVLFILIWITTIVLLVIAEKLKEKDPYPGVYNAVLNPVSILLFAIAATSFLMAVKGIYWWIGHVGITRWYLGHLLATGICVALAISLPSNHREIPNNPISIGILTIWGIRIFKVLLQGEVFIANFIPFKISFLVVDVTIQEHKIPIINVLSGELRDPNGKLIREAVPMSGEIRVSFESIPEQSETYLRNNGAEEIRKQLNDVVPKIAKTITTRHDWLYIMQNALTISKEVEQLIRDELEVGTATLGIKFKRVTGDLMASKKLLDALDAVALEELEKRKEKIDVQTALEKAKLLKKGFDDSSREQTKTTGNPQGTPSPVTLQECFQMAKIQQLIELGLYTYTDAAPHVQVVSVVDQDRNRKQPK